MNKLQQVEQTLKVTVYAGRNLKTLKSNDDPATWVVLSLGKEKYSTRRIKDKNPKWNEEFCFTTTDSRIPLKLKVNSGKNESLGQINIQLTEIPTEEHFLKWLSISPRGSSMFSGEICVDYWIPKGTEKSIDEKPIINKEIKRSGSFGGYLRKIAPFLKDEKSKKVPLAPHVHKALEELNNNQLRRRRHTVSCKIYQGSWVSKLHENIFQDQVVNDGTVETPEDISRPDNEPQKQRRRRMTYAGIPDMKTSLQCFSFAEMNTLAKLPTKIGEFLPPKITNITPTYGTVTGGTLVQIIGSNLGFSKSDVTRLVVAGCDCLSSLEYITPSKIMCTTNESIGVGPITISTESGGASTSDVMFRFINAGDCEDDQDEDSGHSSDGLYHNNRDKNEIIEKLQMKNIRLKEKNREMKEYIDKLLVYVMQNYPNALESNIMQK